MQDPKSIIIEEYDYPLPEERIAKFPLTRRDESKLLHYNEGHISEHAFSEVPSLLPDDSLLIFNETKVVKARLTFRKSTGANIEIFILEPYNTDIQTAFQSPGPTRWKCFIGNAKKWKSGPIHLTIKNQIHLEARKISQEGNAYIIDISSDSHLPFSEVLSLVGEVPLPPYLKRAANADDNHRYQTVFARHDGSVAAPTAGLHFTQNILNDIAQRNIPKEMVTLHVGAGTFKPVVEEKTGSHSMHDEKMVIHRDTLYHLRKLSEKRLTPVGTTSVRTLESLYWYGVKITEQGQDTPFSIPQWYPYDQHKRLSREQALNAVIEVMESSNIENLTGETRLMIVPGYPYHMTDAMFTNFHQPKSTLLLLVSAFLGNDWKKVYEYALKNNFRFLSYGDSCYFQ